jgi:hypothetical protein
LRGCFQAALLSGDAKVKSSSSGAYPREDRKRDTGGGAPEARKPAAGQRS